MDQEMLAAVERLAQGPEPAVDRLAVPEHTDAAAPEDAPRSPARETGQEVLASEAVARCLAAEIVRVKVSAVRRLMSDARVQDISPLLTRPLYAVAAELGVTERVEAYVDEALHRMRHVLGSGS